MNNIKHVCVIAEAGVNHNGSLEIAKKLVHKAKESGADYIKFQTFVPDKLASHLAHKADYQKRATDGGQSQLQMLEKLALTYDDFHKLKICCKELGIGFISTPYDLDSIDFLESLGMDFWKVPSGEVTDLPYLEKIAKTGWDVVVSTGMCEIKEIWDAVKILQENGAGRITLLHCNTEYPTPFEDVNLNAMRTMHDVFNLEIGYSDHTKGIEVSVAAAALGATIIEKHFTLDRNMEGPDHSASLEPNELTAMITSIRNIEKALGTGEKAPSLSEKKNMAAVRKSIVAKKSIKAGEELSNETITVKRPGTGISPMKWFQVLGTKAVKDFQEDEVIEL